MSHQHKRTILKARLAAELANVVFPDNDVPSAAWTTLDKAVDESFGEASTGRLSALVDDLGELRYCDAHPLDGAPTGPSSPSLGDDWNTLRRVISECADELNPPEKIDEDEYDDSCVRAGSLVMHER